MPRENNELIETVIEDNYYPDKLRKLSLEHNPKIHTSTHFYCPLFMSADPKSLATLAIATANAKKNNMSLSNGRSSDGLNSDPSEVLEFRSTDEFVAGLTAALINTTTLFPINKLIFRQMASGQRVKTAAGFMLEDGKYRLDNMV